MYSIPYIAIIIIFGLLSLFWIDTDSKNNKQAYSLACIAIFIFFFGFRGFICDDWINYYPAFQNCSFDKVSFNLLEYNIEWGFEPGFTLLMAICKALTNNYHFLVFICTLMNVSLLLFFFKKRLDNIPLSFVIFLTFGGYVMSTNLMRNSIAILIFVNALTYLEQRKLLPYIGLCILAATFHVSALLYLPLYFIINYRYNKYVYLGLFIIANAIFLLHLPVITIILTHILGDVGGLVQMKIESYTSGNLDEMKTLSIGYLERLFTGIMIFCYYDKLYELREENKVFINLFLLYILASFMLSEFSEISLRVSNLFICAYWIIWIDMMECFSIKNNRRLYICFISLYCVIKMIGNTNLITSLYDNVLFGAKSFEERLYIHNRYSKQ